MDEQLDSEMNRSLSSCCRVSPSPNHGQSTRFSEEARNSHDLSGVSRTKWVSCCSRVSGEFSWWVFATHSSKNGVVGGTATCKNLSHCKLHFAVSLTTTFWGCNSPALLHILVLFISYLSFLHEVVTESKMEQHGPPWCSLKLTAIY